MTKYDYIFWDFDGTIMNTYPGVSESVKYALRFYGIEETDEKNLRSMIGPPFRESFPGIYGFDQETTEEVIKRYRSYYRKGAMFHGDLYPGVQEAAAAFRKAGLRQAVTTSKAQEMCENILEHKGWTVMFDDVFGATLDGRISTKIQVLNEAIRILGNPDRSRIVLIGDTKYDADGAREAGIDCIGVTYGFGTAEDLLGHGACAVFDTLGEVKEFILKSETPGFGILNDRKHPEE